MKTELTLYCWGKRIRKCDGQTKRRGGIRNNNYVKIRFFISRSLCSPVLKLSNSGRKPLKPLNTVHKQSTMTSLVNQLRCSRVS